MPQEEGHRRNSDHLPLDEEGRLRKVASLKEYLPGIKESSEIAFGAVGYRNQKQSFQKCMFTKLHIDIFVKMCFYMKSSRKKAGNTGFFHGMDVHEIANIKIHEQNTGETSSVMLKTDLDPQNMVQVLRIIGKQKIINQ